MNRTKLKVQFTKVVKIKPRLLDIVTIKSGMNKRKSKALKLMFKNLQSIGVVNSAEFDDTSSDQSECSY